MKGAATLLTWDSSFSQISSQISMHRSVISTFHIRWFQKRSRYHQRDVVTRISKMQCTQVMF